MKKLAINLCGVAFALTARANTIAFTDNTFDLGNYSETAVFTTSGSDTVSWTQCPTCGNPGQALQILMTLPTTLDIGAVGFVNNTFSYNPLTQGPIATIDASVDKNLITNIPIDPSTIFGSTFRPLIQQDGLIYLAAITGPTFNGGSTGYSTISQTGLLASDFVQFDFATGTFGTAHPNFSGDPMLFGLGQFTSLGAANVNFEADYDNLSLSIKTVPTVPDSGGTILLLLGSVAALLVLRRTNPRQESAHPSLTASPY